MNQLIIHCKSSALNDIKENNLIYRYNNDEYNCYVDDIESIKDDAELVSYYGLDYDDVNCIELN